MQLRSQLHLFGPGLVYVGSESHVTLFEALELRFETFWIVFGDLAMQLRYLLLFLGPHRKEICKKERIGTINKQERHEHIGHNPSTLRIGSEPVFDIFDSIAQPHGATFIVLS